MLPVVKLDDKNKSDNASPRQAFIKPCTGTFITELSGYSCQSVELLCGGSVISYRLQVISHSSSEPRVSVPQAAQSGPRGPVPQAAQPSQSHEGRCHRQPNAVRATRAGATGSPTQSEPRPKLPALVYHILPSTTAVFSYAIGSRKLSANEQFFCWCSSSSQFVTNDSNKRRCVIYSRQQSLHQHK